MLQNTKIHPGASDRLKFMSTHCTNDSNKPKEYIGAHSFKAH